MKLTGHKQIKEKPEEEVFGQSPSFVFFIKKKNNKKNKI